MRCTGGVIMTWLRTKLGWWLRVLADGIDREHAAVFMSSYSSSGPVRQLTRRDGPVTNSCWR